MVFRALFQGNGLSDPMKSYTILIAGDQAAFGGDIQTSFQQMGFAVRSAENLAEALDVVRATAPEIGGVILNVRCAEEGAKAIQQIRRLDERVPVIIAAEESWRPGAGDGVNDAAAVHVCPPFSSASFLAAWERAAKKGSASQQGTWAFRMVCVNPRMRKIRETLEKVALSPAPVVFRGESGAGKEVLARALHDCSPRANKPFVKLNCAALPSELLESELFGYERGAFTGAFRTTQGKFELADGGSLLLDEIGDMDLKLQAKLLHVLQDCEFYRLGGKKPVQVDVRIIAATHRNLKQAVHDGRFREDLYYRISVVDIEIPPLRRRPEEIRPLLAHFLEKHALPGQKLPAITPELERALLAHDWPGNVRELENVARRLLVFEDSALVAAELALLRPSKAEISAERFSASLVPLGSARTLCELDRARRKTEADVILAALDSVDWNRRKAARLLQIDYKGLLYKMRKLGISKNLKNSRPLLEHLPTGLVV
jgi:two-component system response regulator AtoC